MRLPTAKGKLIVGGHQKKQTKINTEHQIYNFHAVHGYLNCRG